MTITMLFVFYIFQ